MDKKNLAVKPLTTYTLVLIGLVTSITCIIGPLSLPLPFSPVPISFTNFVLYISVFILGWKFATTSLLIYLLLGFVGLPIFSGFTGGPAKLAGPTGGYMFGFIFLTIISGCIIEKFERNKTAEITGMALGAFLCYLFGTIWLTMQLDLTFQQGLTIGVLPYLPGDILKIVIASIVGPILRGRLRRLKIS